jgi:FdhD protein
MTRDAVVSAQGQQLRDGVWSDASRVVPEETAIAFVVDGTAEAVMMATPADLEDFAIGFALTEGLISAPGDVARLQFEEGELGIEARLWLAPGAQRAFTERLRRKTGPVGCGLCGVESLTDAMRTIPPVQSDLRMRAADILAGMAAIAPLQDLHRQTSAVHAAAFYRPGEGIVFLREDVGRHSALDKLVGAMARAGQKADDGAILMTSRVSIELIQKAAFVGAPILAAISAPTALALRAAEAAGIAICAIVRANGLEVFTRPDRIVH